MSNNELNFSNFMSRIPAQVDQEIFQDIVKTENITIERIISQGQSSPETGIISILGWIVNADVYPNLSIDKMNLNRYSYL